MRTTNVTEALAAAGLHQRLYAEPTIVEEFCGQHEDPCATVADCCPGLECHPSGLCWCYVC